MGNATGSTRWGPETSVEDPLTGILRQGVQQLLAAAIAKRSIADFFPAGRSLGAWVAALSSATSAESVRVTLALVGLAYGCSAPQRVSEAGVSWDLACRRAATLTDVRYELEFKIPDRVDEPITAAGRISFQLLNTTDPLVLDFTPPIETISLWQVNDSAVPLQGSPGHLIVPSTALRAGRNEIRIGFVAGDRPLNRNEDYLYSLFVPDRASTCFPCFDQPTLKARYRLTLEIPRSWTAVSNTPVLERSEMAGRAVLRFMESPPLSTYLFSFAAGRFDVLEEKRGERTFRVFHRETDAAKVERNRAAVFDLHASALRWMEEYTGIPYPFQKFDVLLIPSFQYRGMEHPGAILYRASSLFLDETATQNQMLHRASVIAHETAHMWFGNLVTMKWFDDVWLKEVFANFMAAKIVNPSFPDMNHELRFLLAHYPAAYEVDRTAGAHPIRQNLDNLNEAGTLYGAIIYKKAPIVMKHLEGMVGEDAFREGLRAYLRAFRFGNADWAQLIDILDRRTPLDLRSWSRVWVEEPDRPVVSVHLRTKDGKIEAMEIRQRDPAGKGRLWSQRLQVLLRRGDVTRFIPAVSDRSTVEVPEAVGLPAPDVVLANGKGVGYGQFELGNSDREFLLRNLPALPDPLTRGIAWISLWEDMLEGRVPPGTLRELCLRALPEENDELNVSRVLSYLARLYWKFLSESQRKASAARIEGMLWRLMESAPTKTLKSDFFEAYRDMALSEEGVSRLRSLWEGRRSLAGLTLSEADLSALAQQLALRGPTDAEDILSRQYDRMENPDRKREFAFVRPALSAAPGIRRRFFESLKEEKNREHEPWVLAALSCLHHPLRARNAEEFILPSLLMLPEIQRTGDIFFPLDWLSATFGGHRTSRAAKIVRDYLRDHPDLPTRLRAKVLQAADELFRASRIVSPQE